VFQFVILTPHYIVIFLTTSVFAVVNGDKHIGSPVLSTNIRSLRFSLVIFATETIAYHSHFFLGCECSGFCRLFNAAEILFLSGTVRHYFSGFQLEKNRLEL